MCLCSKGKLKMRKIPLYSHWMSNFQPSSSASEGDIWLYALHDKYFPASERLSVIDNVLVVWFPSLDVCGKSERKFIFFSIFFSLPFAQHEHTLLNKSKKKSISLSHAHNFFFYPPFLCIEGTCVASSRSLTDIFHLFISLESWIKKRCSYPHTHTNEIFITI